MARPGRLRFAPSHRDKLAENNTADRGYAAMYGKEPAFQSEIKPVRKYAKRTETQREAPVLEQVIEAARAIPGVRVWRNARGLVDLAGGGKLKFGLGPNGSADVLGWKRIIITPAMVGKEIAVFVSIETKGGDTATRENQLKWCDLVQNEGGIALFARSAAEAEAILKR